MPLLNRRVVTAAFIALFFIGGAWFYSLFSGGFKGDTVTQPQERVSVAERGAPSLGRADAPVTIIEFADFQCPSCAVFHFGAGAVIFDRYVKQGTARFVLKQFPLLGEESYTAAYAAECAKEKGIFWEYHDALFARAAQSEGENSGMFSLVNLVRIGEELGLDANMFSECVRAEKYKAAVLADIEDGKQAGVEGTPTVFINGRKFEGALPFETYKTGIEEELGK